MLTPTTRCPEISVVLPVHNAEQYIRKSIESIQSQSFNNFELIVIDDGSNDGTNKILKEIALLDARIKIFNTSKQGIVKSLNFGISIARGKWIARMDADDISMPGRFESQLNLLRNSNSDICGAWVKLVGYGLNKTLKYPLTDQEIKIALLFGTCFAHPTVMMSAKFAKNNLYDPDYENAEDYELWVRAAILGYKLCNVPEILLKYRIHTGQISKLASHSQIEKTKKLREYYISHIFNRVNSSHIQFSLAMRSKEGEIHKIEVNELFIELNSLSKSLENTEKKVLLSCLFPIFISIAHQNLYIYKLWEKLTSNSKIWLKIIFLIFYLINIKPDTKLFNVLKNFYLKYK